MSLAQKSDQPTAGADGGAPAPSGGARIGTPIDFRQLARRVVAAGIVQTIQPPPPAAIRPAPPVVPQPPALPEMTVAEPEIAAAAPAAAVVEPVAAAPAPLSVPEADDVVPVAPVQAEAEPAVDAPAAWSDAAPANDDAGPDLVPEAAGQAAAVSAGLPEAVAETVSAPVEDREAAGATAVLPAPDLASELSAPAIAAAAMATATAALDGSRSSLAFELLDEVAQALTILMTRCERLENAVAITHDVARADLTAAADAAREWEAKAQQLQDEMDAMARETGALRRRAEAAEAEAAEARATLESSQKAAAEAECLSSLFSAKVIGAFGAGSPAHSILESVRSRTDQLLSA